MNEIELIVLAMRIESDREREAWLANECGTDLNKLARIKLALQRAHERILNPTQLNDVELRQQIQAIVTEVPINQLGQTELESKPNVDAKSTAHFDSIEQSRFVIAGRYTLLQKIGEGGMGEVWRAKQSEPIKRQVALKLIKKGMDSKAVVSRFEQERQALAVMDHPNIARVYDGGMTDQGQPFFAMELVGGQPLIEYADKEKLTTEERLQLFVHICNAVQHAHQKGIVHRDLKPANILVTTVDGKPVPKVIDFGVAKATGGRLTDESMGTQFGAIVGTLEYMAPEQAG